MAQDPYRYFRVEARELAEQIGQSLLELEKRPAAELVGRLLRHAHTLKGAARVVKEAGIADRAHTIEDVLAPYRDTATALPAGQIARLLGLVDEVTERVAALTPAASGTGPPGTGPPRDGAPVESTAVAASAADVDELFDAIGEAHSHLVPLRQGVASVARARRGVELLVELLAPTATGAASSRADPSGQRARSIAADLAGELATLSRGLTRTVEATERELRQVRASAERLRLVPAATIFTALHRAVRDAAQTQRRNVVFEASGGDVRLDPQVLSAAHTALLHIVRNAVAHGIEPEADRHAAGKPAEGRVVVEVERRGGRIAFTCRDDGRGFDLDAVRREVRLRGVPAAEAGELGSQQLVGLLLRGGISTSDSVTEVSGRGVGLDVVRDVAERLGGEVAVQTGTGRGATVELLVPVSVVALDALVMEVAGAPATVALDSVRHTMRLRPEEIASSASGATIRYDGQAIPFLHLGHRSPGHPAVAVVVGTATGTAAVGVDRLTGTAEVVVRPLPDLAPADAVVGGVWLDGAGTPRVALDPDGLVARARRDGGDRAAGPAAATPRPILVIDDSLTTRMLEQSILETAGYEVDAAASGEEALDKARSSRYALFLVDIEMPGMDGFTFIEHTRADPALRDIPSILVSSRASAEDRRRGMDAGARLHVAKNEFDQNVLLEHIGRLVGRP